MEKYTYTQNIKAAAALTTLGFKHKESSPCVRVHREDGKETSSFWFEEHGPNGLRASRVIHWMTKGHAELEESDPEHPVNYIRAGFVNRETWIDVHKSTPASSSSSATEKSSTSPRTPTKKPDANSPNFSRNKNP